MTVTFRFFLIDTNEFVTIGKTLKIIILVDTQIQPLLTTHLVLVSFDSQIQFDTAGTVRPIRVTIPMVRASKFLRIVPKIVRFNKLTSVFYASVLLLIMNFVITSSSYDGIHCQ